MLLQWSLKVILALLKFVLADFLTKINTPNYVTNILCVRTGYNPFEKVKKISWPQIITNVEKSTFHTFFPKNPWNSRFGFGFFGVEQPQM